MLFQLVPLFVTISETALVVAAPPAARPGPSQTSRNNVLQINPLPNPFPIPDTPYSLDFGAPGPDLPRRNVHACVLTIRLEMVAYMRLHGGDGKFESREWPCKVDNIVFGIALNPVALGAPFVTWDDAYDVLDAFSAKMYNEGYHGLWATVMYTDGGKVVGRARIGPDDS